MSDMKWTDEQEKAIGASGAGIVVSAAAGSGKTTVLTHRIIRRICDENADISRITALTFTRAAALQMRSKITSVLNERLAKSPDNARIRSQKLMLGHAKIMTTDSYCLALVREKHALVDYPSDFRVLDENELGAIEQSVMRELIEYCFETRGVMPDGTQMTDYKAVFDTFGKYNDHGRAVEKLTDLHDSLQQKADFIDLLGLDDTGDYPVGSPWIDVIYRRVAAFASYYKPILESALRQCDIEDLFYRNYFNTMHKSLEITENALKCVTERKGYPALRSCFSEKLPSAGSSRQKGVEYSDEAKKYKDLKSKFNLGYKTISDTYFSYTDDEIYASAGHLKNLRNDLRVFLNEYDRRLKEEKKFRRVMSFNDVARNAYSILYNADGTLSETAREIRAATDELYIDEYQDTNEIQEKIFSAIAEEDRVFRVGDVKQSLYEFRGAVPEIMSGKLAGCVKYGEEEGDRVKIFLPDNFRSEKPIIDFTNRVFDTMMRFSPTVGYTVDDRLRCTKDKVKDGAGCELVLIDSGDENISEERYVARRIKNMVASETLDGGKINYSDIAVLLRTVNDRKNTGEKFIKAFEEEGVPCRNAGSGNLFRSPAVLLALCVLNVVDDPEKDSYLTGLMCSPLYGISFDKAVEIRRFKPDGSMYSALKEYSEKTGFGRGKRLIKDTETHRRKAKNMPCDEFLWYIYGSYGFFNFADGDDAMLRDLYECARRFETGGFKGLDSFIVYLQNVIDRGGTVRSSASGNGTSDAVTIMSAHHSKGLEFPVCFFCDANHGFYNNVGDSALAPTCVIAPKMPDKSGVGNYDTVFAKAKREENLTRMKEETMRTLYVVMTRAMSRLVITGSVDDPRAVFKEKCERDAPVSEYEFYSADSPLDWLLTSSAKWLSERDGDGTFTVTLAPDMPEPAEAEAPEAENKEKTDYSSLLDRIGFAYPRASLSKLPLKFAVSDLFPTVLDDAGKAVEFAADRTVYKPRFICESEDYELTPAERGTALHIFMQFCDFSRIETDGAEAETERLRRLGFLSDPQARSIRPEEINGFMKSRLYSRMKNAVETYRERRFIVGMPAADFTGDSEKRGEYGDETILVQGVIDCAFTESDGKLCLVDYKTDRFPKQTSRAEIEAALKERHGLQLGYYKKAVEIMFGRAPDETVVYSFALSDTVVID